MNGNILITGVAGFIGSNLADSLIKNNFKVIGIDNLSYGVYEQIQKGSIFTKLISETRIFMIYFMMYNTSFI